MQQAALVHLGLTGWRYQLLPIPPALVEETLRALPGAGFAGVNVTIPHKQAALALATHPTERARAIGAANTLVYGDDGTIVADNTDAPALAETLGALGVERPRSALVLGAGGSARAAVWALRDAGVAELAIWNRTPERAVALAAAFDARPVSDAEASRPVELIVNCTAAELHGADPFTALPITAAQLARCRAFADYAYGEGATRLLAAARQAGVPAIDGLELLVVQGALALERFTGRPAPREVMRAAVRRSSVPESP
jgi:shikimate dehydrogenase